MNRLRKSYLAAYTALFGILALLLFLCFRIQGVCPKDMGIWISLLGLAIFFVILMGERRNEQKSKM